MKPSPGSSQPNAIVNSSRESVTLGRRVRSVTDPNVISNRLITVRFGELDGSDTKTADRWKVEIRFLSTGSAEEAEDSSPASKSCALSVAVSRPLDKG